MSDHYTQKASKPSHTRGTKRGEERIKTGGKEPGRKNIFDCPQRHFD